MLGMGVKKSTYSIFAVLGFLLKHGLIGRDKGGPTDVSEGSSVGLKCLCKKQELIKARLN